MSRTGLITVWLLSEVSVGGDKSCYKSCVVESECLPLVSGQLLSSELCVAAVSSLIIVIGMKWGMRGGGGPHTVYTTHSPPTCHMSLPYY